MTREQLKYCTAIIKQLKRHRDAPAFLNPVDIVLLKIPDYPSVVKYPMDLSTVERKLTGIEYDTVDDFVRDVNLIFTNCYLYNGQESPVSICASNLETAFLSSLRHMPKDKEDIKALTPVSASAPEYTTMDFTQSRAASEERRPKRDIHAPSKEMPTAIVKKKGAGKWKSDPQLRYCHSILKEFSKKANAEFMFPFMEPVDYVKLNIPDYPKIIKNPMDIGTVRQKLEDDEYDNAALFEADVRLVLWNCFKFNPAGTPVHIMGRRMEKLFNDKWAERPAPPTPPPVVEEAAAGSDSEDSADEKIAEMERHLKTLSEKLKQMKAAKKKERADKKSAKATQDKPSKPKTASKTPAKAPAKTTPPKAAAPERKKAPVKRSRPVYSSDDSSSEDDVPTITFEQKKELSDSINKFEGEKLANVVQIIHNSMPHLRDNGGQEEIELDMDSLDPRTLYKLYQYVKKNTAPKRKKPAPKKVKVQYSEEDATKKISELERTLQKFEQPAMKSIPLPPPPAMHDGYSSSSSGSSSSSDSDSDSGSSSD
ncbi:Bromodomain-containing protein [Mortierella sp. GBAus27b]|nr:Bromodomain-containing protein [Mortierella sp. GBAus27b]